MARERTQVYDVKGMTCSSCAVRVERQLSETPGVEEATVNFASGKAFVSGDVPTETLVSRLDAIGYALVVPDTGKEHVHEHEEASEARRRMWIAIGHTVPLMALHELFGHEVWSGWLQFALAAAVVAGAGRGFFIRAAKLARHLAANMDTLVALGAGAALVYGSALLFSGKHGPYFFDAAGMIVSFILIGKYLETRATARAGAALRALLDLSPKTAARIESNGSTRTVPVVEVVVGDRLRVAPGERIPVDAEIVSGKSEIDESLATGESVPVLRGPGESVLGGTINGGGVLEIRARAVGKDSFLAQMVALVEEAQGSKPPIQRIADKISSVFVPAMIVVAIVTALAWWWTGHGLGESLLPAVAVLLIACPCAFGLATPTAILTASGRAAKEGVLIRNGVALEQAGRLDALVIDKTGTLTEGRPRVVEFLNNVGEGRDPECFALAAALERGSEHPMGRAILAYAEPRRSERLEAVDVQAEAGAGIWGMVGDREVAVGTFEFIKSRGADLRHLLRDSTNHPVASRAYLLVGKKIYGIFYLEDTLRAGVKEALAELHALGVEPMVATGDTAQVASYVGNQLGIRNIRAALKPEEKKRLIAELRAQGRYVGMVGDGINDAAALAMANVGFAVGSGTDVALQSADVTLVGGDLGRVARVMRLSRRTLRIIRQNFFWALLYNIGAVPVAALGYLKPEMAAAAMALSSVSVVANSLRLQRKAGGEVRRAAFSGEPKEEGKKESPVREVEFSVEGMTCQHCVQSVTKALEQVSGVEKAEVDLESGKARVRYNATEATVELLRNAVRGAGYKVTTDESRFRMGYQKTLEEDFHIT